MTSMAASAVVDSDVSPTLSRGAVTRERIVEAATELFSARGLRAVSADKVIERAGITKVTFYRHFPTKDDLILAYLEGRAAWERNAVARIREMAADDPRRAFDLLAEGIGAESCRPGFRGCAFINAAAEYADPHHPVRAAVAAHRKWFKEQLVQMLDALGANDLEACADELVMLRDGAMVTGYLADPAAVSRLLKHAAGAVIEAHCHVC